MKNIEKLLMASALLFNLTTAMAHPGHFENEWSFILIASILALAIRPTLAWLKNNKKR